MILKGKRGFFQKPCILKGFEMISKGNEISLSILEGNKEDNHDKKEKIDIEGDLKEFLSLRKKTCKSKRPDCKGRC